MTARTDTPAAPVTSTPAGPTAGPAAAPSADPDAHRFARSAAAQAELHRLVPGGAHTYARGSDQYPEHMTPVLVRGEGAHVWDVDGNEFVEYGMGLRAVTLGHGYRPVLDAVRAVLDDGLNFTRPTTLELDAARDLVELVPGADMVKFAKNGSDATTAAVRLSRLVTGRDRVAVCTDQPFFSTDDWFIGTTAMPGGVPQEARGLTTGFAYDDLGSLRTALAGRDVACVVMEAATATLEPSPGYLAGVRALCDETGTLLVLDEMITGFRWSERGAQHVHDVVPDLSCWGKAMGNGFPVSALVGRREVMERGGLGTDAERAFLLSTTHGAETVSLAAFRAVVAAYRREDPVAAMERAGRRLAEGVEQVSRAAGTHPHVRTLGRPSCLVFTSTGPDGAPSQAYRALLLQELLRRGVLGQSFVISAAHTDTDVDRTVEALAGALTVYRRALDAGTTDGLLHSRPVAPALRAQAHPRRLPTGAPPQ
ncbi:glutamate-1-semialdehyde 2,1-aminomutase [Rhodococcus aerolatus]